MWRTFLTRTIVDWSFDAPIPSRDPSSLDRFPDLEDRDDLWQLLCVLTVRKAINLVKHEGRRSRGGGRLVSLSDLEEELLDGASSTEPGPASSACWRYQRSSASTSLRTSR